MRLLISAFIVFNILISSVGAADFFRRTHTNQITKSSASSRSIKTSQKPRLSFKKPSQVQLKPNQKHKFNFPVELSIAQSPGALSENNPFGLGTNRVLDWNRDDLKWYFMWKSKGKSSIKRLVWQVSQFPFPDDNKKWTTPPGLVSKGNILTGNAIFKIDFGKFAPSPKDVCRTLLNRNNLITLDRSFKKSIQGRRASSKDRKTISKLTKETGKAIRKKQKYPFVKKSAQTLKLHSTVKKTGFHLAPLKQNFHPVSQRDYYIRIIALDKNGKLAASPSNTVVLTYGEVSPATEIVWNEPVDTRVHIAVPNPKMEVIEYEPIRPERYNAHYSFVVFKEPTGIYKQMFHVGQKLILDPYAKGKSKSFWDHIGDAISGAISFIADAVNWASRNYASLKRNIAVFVANRVPGVDADFVEGLIDSALVSMGIPPTLPNFDELTDMGIDYLATTMAEQANVPADIARDAAHKFVNEAKKASNSGGAGIYEFLRLDPEVQFRPAYLKLKFSNPHSLRTLPLNLYFEDKAKIFETTNMAIPSIRPGKSFVVPLFLRQNNDYWNLSKPDALSDDEWYKRYTSWPMRSMIHHSLILTQDYLAEVLGLYMDKNNIVMDMMLEGNASFMTKANKAWAAP